MSYKLLSNRVHRWIKSQAQVDQITSNATDTIIAELRKNFGYLARRELDEIRKNISIDPQRLEPFGFKVYSQNDEDGIIEEIFNRLGISQGRFCEIGVENGLQCNTLFLIHKGWRGWWIEADTIQAGLIQNKFASLLENGRLQLLINFVTADNIDTNLKKFEIDKGELDFLSIDIDGNDIHVMDAMHCYPKVICIEYNAKFPPPLSKIPVYDSENRWQGGDYMGASLVAIDEAAKKKGYTLVGTNITGANSFFVRNDLVGNLFCINASTKYLYNPPRYWLSDAFDYVGHRADFGPYVDLA